MQLPLQAVRPCRTLEKPRGGDVTTKRKNTLTNQKPGEKQKWCITKNGSTTTMARCKGVMWSDNEFGLLLNMTLE